MAMRTSQRSPSSCLGQKSQRSDVDDAEALEAGSFTQFSDAWQVSPNVRHLALHGFKKVLPSCDSSVNPSSPSPPYALSPGETAVFIFQTSQDYISDQQLTELLTVANVKVFIITANTSNPETSRARLEKDEMIEKLDDEEELFHSVESSSFTVTPTFSCDPPSSTAGWNMSQSALQSNHSLSSLKLASTGSVPLSCASQGFHSSILSSSKLDGHSVLKKKLNDVFHFSLYEEAGIFSPTTKENFWTPPTMLLWRCGLAASSHYSMFFHYEPDLPLELPKKLQEEASTYGSILTLKSLTSPNILPCYASFPPAYTPSHLYDLTSSAACKGGAEGFTVLMVSASDCPPCRKVFSQAKRLWDSLPQNTSLYKVDWYLAKELRECFVVEKIPFFILLKNSEILRFPNFIASNTTSSPMCSAQQKWNPIDSLQQSDLDRIIFFIEHHTKPLSFDEDF